ncbi:hypothetical protein ACFFX0_08015 [Citricoccus parietis]|uniref:Uncharacterized protein n=1 Tax=Citricoccus parietis TaxID=592307 RepID=A0ABV5FWU4_9MICC
MDTPVPYLHRFRWPAYRSVRSAPLSCSSCRGVRSSRIASAPANSPRSVTS